ncbi:MAG: SDR family NAD(P)-dependent oxidoreductase, partial [Candidatus Pacearchaeota archaeon]|nr:SDR family NAD(P)-dependent oxidoreductase [Candidatus Pacearchaeota archaeon]
LHENTSTLQEQRFTSKFTGKEFFFKDHMISGKKVLPGAVYLEMIRAAIEKTMATDTRTIVMENIVWSEAFSVNERSKEINIALFPEGDEGLAYEIYGNNSLKGEEIVYSQGKARIVNNSIELERKDLEAIRKQCNKGEITKKECYEAFEKMGICYGAGHQAVRELYRGENLVLGRLELPDSLAADKDRYVLHPSIMDGAFQASIGLMPDNNMTKPKLPFALEKLEILSKCTGKMWGIIKYSGDGRTDGEVQKIDIDLCDEQGNVCAKMKGFSLRVLEGEQSRKLPAHPSDDEDLSMSGLTGGLKLISIWNPTSKNNNGGSTVLKTVAVDKIPQLPGSNEKIVIIGGSPEQHEKLQQLYSKITILSLQTTDTINRIAGKIKELDVINHIFWFGPDNQSLSLTEEKIIKEQEKGVIQLFRVIKALLNSGYENKDLGLTVITYQTQAVNGKEEIVPAHAGVHGLIGSLAKEYPNWYIRLVDLPSIDVCPVEKIITLAGNKEGNAYAYRDNEWYQQELVHIKDMGAGKSIYKPDGVYVVIGGAGGLGRIWSRWMIEKYRARIIWLGRKPENKEIRMAIEELSPLGPEPLYISADAADLKSLESAYEKIKEKYPDLNGVIHSAIVLKDQSLAKMEEETFLATLAAKVNISVNLSLVFQKNELDFVLFFSSIISFAKAPGQSNYAAGCTFKDAFGYQLNRKWTCPVKVINWGYWGSTGIAAGKEYQDRMTRTGIGSIEPEEGMEILENFMASPFPQMGFVKVIKPGVIESFTSKDFISIQPREINNEIKEKVLIIPDKNKHGDEVLKEKGVNYIKEMISKTLKIPIGKIYADEQLEKYGLDSIEIVPLTNTLSKNFENINRTFFYEFQTIDAIVDYLLKTQRENIVKLLGVKDHQQGIKEVLKAELSTIKFSPQKIQKKRYRYLPEKETIQDKIMENKIEDIAIIGISGRYPEAKDVEEYWDNLKQG